VSLSSRTVARQFPEWTFPQCKAYRAGALAGLRGKSICSGYEYEVNTGEDVTLFFFRGYADAIGEGAEGEEWFDEISEWRIEERWWEETTDSAEDFDD
jgi:hypothetical protein